MTKSKIDVLVLSGGAGKRLKKKLKNTPKGLMMYRGVCALTHITSLFDKDLFNINLNIGKDEEKAFKKAVKYKLLVEKTRVGNAGAIKLFYKKLTDPFIVIHNDILIKDFDAFDFYMEHKENMTDNCIMTVAITDVGKKKENGVITRHHNIITGLTRRRFINCGIYCINHAAMNYIQRDVFQDIDEDFIQRLIELQREHDDESFNKTIAAYEHVGRYESWGK